jgi:hypothetical protein
MSKQKELRVTHIPHQLWSIACELEGLGILLQNQTLNSPESLHFDEGMEGLGRIIARSAKKLRRLSRLVDEREVKQAQKLNRNTKQS